MKSKKQQDSLAPKDDANGIAAAPASSREVGLVVGVCIFLALMVWVVFGQTRFFSFVNFDDNKYIFQLPAVINGLNIQDVVLAFSWKTTDNWVPLTTLSHLLDWQLYGANAGGHHLTNVLLHGATAILLFLVLYRMTASRRNLDATTPSGRRSALWRSAFVAAVFAIHPLRAESVAWVTERKDVLSGMFFMLTLWAYWGYARKPQSLLRYLLALLLYALALLSKSMVVTLPFILLLLDYWPLRRWGWARPAHESSPSSSSPMERGKHGTTVMRLVVEKAPFLLLALASCVPTILAEHTDIASGAKMPFVLTIENAPVSCVAYIWQFFYPARLAPFYPFPNEGLPFLEVAGALAVLLVVSLAVFHWRQKYPYLLTGWFWYLIMLVPVIGLFQVGEQARADRFTYLPQIGLCLLLTWFVADWSAGNRGRRMGLAGLSCVILAGLLYGGHQQTSYWKDSETVWKHALSCTPANPTEHFNLGLAYEAEGRMDEAIVEFKKALELGPDYTAVNFNYGNVLASQGRLDEAIAQYQGALRFDQGRAASEDCLAMGNALLQKGQLDDAIAQYLDALEDNPGNAAACNNLSAAIWVQTKSAQTSGEETLAVAKNANQIVGGNSPQMLRALAAAYARCGQFPEAVEAGKNALALAVNNQPAAFVNTLEQEIALYQAGSPLPIVTQTNTNSGVKR